MEGPVSTGEYADLKVRRMQLRMSAEERAQIEEAASAAGISMSEWMLRAAHEQRLRESVAAEAAAASYDTGYHEVVDALVERVASRLEILRLAAKSAHRSVADYVSEILMHTSEQVLADRRHFELDPPAWERFLEALDRPERSDESLEALMATQPSDELLERLRG